MQEPIYDPQRLATDKTYLYNLIDQLTAYMNSIEPYSDRVLYFMKMTKLLGFADLSAMNMGGRGIEPETPVFNKCGKPMCKYWHLSQPANDEEDSIRRKLWFMDWRYTAVFNGKKPKPLEERKKQYFLQLENYAPTDLARLHLESVDREIERFNDEYNKLKDANTDVLESVKAKKYRREAVELIQDELQNGNVIEWLSLNSRVYYTPLAFLWDMIEYKRFLQQQLSKATKEIHIAVTKLNQPEKTGSTTRTILSSKGNRAENERTQTTAFIAVAKFRDKIEEVFTSNNTINADEIVKKAIVKWSTLAEQLRIGSTPRSLDRYIKDENKGTTAKEFGRQVVRQLKARNNLKIK